MNSSRISEPVEVRAARVRERFQGWFGAGADPVVASAPGRVNLIGEHTDYNDGYVFPAAIDYRIEVAVRRRPDEVVRIHSFDFDETVEYPSPVAAAVPGAHTWHAYPRGVVFSLQREGVALSGFDMVLTGDVPLGAGLSSSAALEVATALALQGVFGFALDGPAMALLCQRAENEFVGMRCGIMDQFIARMGRAGHALLIDCRSLEHRQVPLALAEHRLVVCDSRVKHALVGSEYNVRRAQCEEGVQTLARALPGIRALRDVTLQDLEAHGTHLSRTVYRRCRHVVSENERVLASVAALIEGDLAAFGAAMNASHDSLRDDYEVSCPEIDLLVDLARALPGTLGARITGGGFGGSTVNLMTAEAAARFEEAVVEPFARRMGHRPHVFTTSAADGAQLV